MENLRKRSIDVWNLPTKIKIFISDTQEEAFSSKNVTVLEGFPNKIQEILYSQKNKWPSSCWIGVSFIYMGTTHKLLAQKNGEDITFIHVK